MNLPLLDDPSAKKQVIQFSPEAANRWLDIFNTIEGEIRYNGHFFDAGDHATKLADNIARVAAILHFFEGAEEKITLPTLEAAIQICLWYSKEFMRLFVPPPPIPQEQLDVEELGGWLWNQRNIKGRYIRKNHVRQHAPNKLRQKNRLNLALDVLAMNRVILFVHDGKTAYIDLDPGSPPDPWAWQVAISTSQTR